MRKKSLATKPKSPDIYAVSGTYAIILSFDMKEADTKGLLGFTVEREDHTENEKYTLPGLKRFIETAPNPVPGQLFSTREHPVQSFLWEDFTAKPKHDYTYSVTPVKGKPKKLEFGNTNTIAISTEEEASGTHSVIFNMGVAGSLAYARKFKNQKPSEMTVAKRAEALKWLSRGLWESFGKFIDQAKDKNFGLRCCFYEFSFIPALEILRQATVRKADVKIIYDSRKEKKENEEAIETASLHEHTIIPRATDPQKLSHNKFMILLENGAPTQVWTGSMNITEKAIFGHSNVAHIIRDPVIAQKYLDYWTALSGDPDSQTAKATTATIQNDVTADILKTETTTKVFFSPRPTQKMGTHYADIIRGAKEMVCGIFPFSFHADIKDAFMEDKDYLKYLLIDKKDKNTTFVNNDIDTLIVYGGSFDDALYDWLAETNAGQIFNKNSNDNVGTNFVHNKVILVDPLSADPIVIIGSANFSKPSLLDNDENTLVIHDHRTADIYMTEFVRLFNHYYARQLAELFFDENNPSSPTVLKTDDSWVKSFYNPIGLKQKRKQLFKNMHIPA